MLGKLLGAALCPLGAQKRTFKLTRNNDDNWLQVQLIAAASA